MGLPDEEPPVIHNPFATRPAGTCASASGAATGTAYHGHAPGYVQANSRDPAEGPGPRFPALLRAEPQALPAAGEFRSGRSLPAHLGARTSTSARNIGMYRVWRDGEMVAEVPDIRDLWCDDLVAFLMAARIPFEEALEADGLPLRHMEEGKAVPSITPPCRPCRTGPFTDRSSSPCGPSSRRMRSCDPDHVPLPQCAWGAGGISASRS